jgi:hypothetical protein
MGLFKENLTDLEVFIKENFNSEPNAEYTFEVEAEGEFVKIQLPIVMECSDSGGLTNEHTIKTKFKLPDQQRD